MWRHNVVLPKNEIQNKTLYHILSPTTFPVLSPHACFGRGAEAQRQHSWIIICRKSVAHAKSQSAVNRRGKKQKQPFLHLSVKKSYTRTKRIKDEERYEEGSSRKKTNRLTEHFFKSGKGQKGKTNKTNKVPPTHHPFDPWNWHWQWFCGRSSDRRPLSLSLAPPSGTPGDQS